MDGVHLVEDCLTKLNLPELICRRSRMVLQEWIDMELTKDCKDNALLTVSAIYTALIEDRTESASPSEEGPRFTLLQILRAGNVNIKQFLEFMNVIGKTYQHSRAMKECLLATQAKYLITIGIYNTFLRLMKNIFETSSDNCYRQRVCWCLFLVAKVNVLPENTELIPSLNLMLCCLDYIVRQSHGFMMKEPFRSAKERLQEDKLSVLRVIKTSFSNDANFEELVSTQTNCFHPFIQSLPQEVLNQTADGLPKLQYFERKYKAEYEKMADIDEMAFLDNDPLLTPVRAPSPDSTVSDTVPPIPQTPVRYSVRTAQSLNTLLANVTDRPSENLLSLLNEYGPELANDITRRTERLRDVFVQNYARDKGQTVAQTRYRLGVRLYNREMEQFIKKERDRNVASSSIFSLLSTDLFHRCLLACSLEVVKVYYEYMASPKQGSSIGNGGLDFPWILTTFDVHPYDFCRVIETFITEEAQLSEQAIKHLTNVEEFILESEAWKEGSPLLVALRARIANAGQTNEPGTAAVASSGEGDLFFLNKFLRKVQQLSYKRLEKLAADLGLSDALKRRIWTCLDHCLTQMPDLLESRHIDQVLMCCIYAICKIAGSHSDRKLKTIAAVYQKLPHAKASTFKQVKIENDVSGHIIRFYNEVFVPAMKNYILSFQQSESQPSSPVPGRTPSTPSQQRSYRLHPNLTVSPLRHSPFKSPSRQAHTGSDPPPTPRTLLLICTGEDFMSEKLENYNRHHGTGSKRKQERLGSDRKFSKKLKYDGGASDSVGKRVAKRLLERPAGSSNEEDKEVLSDEAQAARSPAEKDKQQNGHDDPS